MVMMVMVWLDLPYLTLPYLIPYPLSIQYPHSLFLIPYTLSFILYPYPYYILYSLPFTPLHLLPFLCFFWNLHLVLLSFPAPPLASTRPCPPRLPPYFTGYWLRTGTLVQTHTSHSLSHSTRCVESRPWKKKKLAHSSTQPSNRPSHQSINQSIACLREHPNQPSKPSTHQHSRFTSLHFTPLHSTPLLSPPRPKNTIVIHIHIYIHSHIHYHALTHSSLLTPAVVVSTQPNPANSMGSHLPIFR